MLIPCPHCGTRPVEEFTFLGDATVARPVGDDHQAWDHYVYLRDNPKGAFQEFAHHAGGCRAWLVVSRNTETHEVSGAVVATDFKKAKP
jgi:heterotetrameric sarcosine oxidase delta subunit